MASNYWIKMWIEMLDDPKMGRLPDNLWRRFVECCLLAGELHMDGRLPPIHDIAWRLRVDEEALRSEFDQMARIGLVDYVNKPLDEHWIVSKFEKRQEKMTSAERGKRFRQKQKKQAYYEPDLLERTETERFVRRSDTDTDKDLIKKRENFAKKFHELSGLFSELTPQDEEIILSWVENEVMEEDIKNAISYSEKNDLPIISPGSIHKGVMIERAKRARKANGVGKDEKSLHYEKLNQNYQ